MAEDDDMYYYSGEDDVGGDDNLYADFLLEDDATVHCSRSVPSVITKESLLAAQKEDLSRVMELLALKEQHARTLLIHYRWDLVRIVDLLDRKGRDRLFLEAGVTIAVNICNASSSSAPITCYICFQDVPPSETATMDCGHCFCCNCWIEHFIVKINDGQSRRIRCMAHKCSAICDEGIVRRLVNERDTDLAARFDRFLLESYIEDNDKVKWCPSKPHCGNAIRVEGDKYCEVECTCGLQFCFNCLSEAHSPCSCLMWELWAKKCSIESKNYSWITKNTKPCPRCHKSVQKNGGCNLVQCICGQAFCWLCGDATGTQHTWENISGHSCNRFKDEKHMMAELAKRNIDRYLHYHNRYQAHCESLKQESNLKITMQKRISLSESKHSLQDHRWVLEGLDRLFKSRRILSYTYPFAYYMFGDELFKNEMMPKERLIKKTLFEDQQKQLESNVEKLSMFLEKDFQDFTNAEIFEMRRHVKNIAAAVDTFCKQMYESIDEDLLGSLQFCTHSIAPYTSIGLQKASEISVCLNYDQNLSYKMYKDGSCVQQDYKDKVAVAKFPPPQHETNTNDISVQRDSKAKVADVNFHPSQHGTNIKDISVQRDSKAKVADANFAPPQQGTSNMDTHVNVQRDSNVKGSDASVACEETGAPTRKGVCRLFSSFFRTR